MDALEKVKNVKCGDLQHIFIFLTEIVDFLSINILTNDDIERYINTLKKLQLDCNCPQVFYFIK